MSKRHDKNQKGKKKGRKNNSQGPIPSHRMVNINTIPRAPRLTIAENMLVSMDFVHTLNVAPGSPGTNIGWLSNSVITPYTFGGVVQGTQPVVGGVASFAIQYGYYRVLGYHFRLEILNTGSAPAEFVLTHTNPDVSANTFAQLRTMAITGKGRSDVAGSSSTSACKLVFTGKRANAGIVGKESYFTDDQYAGVIGVTLTPSIPADQTHMTLGGLVVGAGSNLTYTFTLSMRYVVELYNPMPVTA